jgi:hypothetical protein
MRLTAAVPVGRCRNSTATSVRSSQCAFNRRLDVAIVRNRRGGTSVHVTAGRHSLEHGSRVHAFSAPRTAPEPVIRFAIEGCDDGDMAAPWDPTRGRSSQITGEGT